MHGAAALLLVAAGAAKLTTPAEGFFGLLGDRSRPALVRLLGAAEIVAGGAALGLGGPVAASAVGVLYGSFAVAVLRARRAGAATCGCFGRLDAPPSRIHVVGNLAMAAVSLVAAGAARPPAQQVVEVLRERPGQGVALAVEVVVLAGLALVAFTALPEALGARVSQRRRPGLFGAVPERPGARIRARVSGGGIAVPDNLDAAGPVARTRVLVSGGGR